MKIYSYIITRDYGFAPNPFYGYCTLATCKPRIRLSADIGDVIVGLGSGAKNSIYKNKLIYVMIVSKKITFDEYWDDQRFFSKRPQIHGSLKHMYGDNIYHTDPNTGQIIQENSHHSLDEGKTNYKNLERDTSGKYVLISNQFWYWGSSAVDIPKSFLGLTDVGRGYKVVDDEKFVSDFIGWLEQAYPEKRMYGFPHHFNDSFTRYSGE